MTLRRSWRTWRSCRFWAGGGKTLKKLAGGIVEVVEVEADQCQLRSVMSTCECVGATNLLSPVPGQTRGFVDVAMEREQRLAIFDEALDGDAPNIEIERRVIDGASIECGPIEIGPIRRGVEEENRCFEIAIFGESDEIGRNGPEANLVGFDRYGSLAPFR